MEKEQKSQDAVNHPSHYNHGKIEVLDFIQDQSLNYNRGSVIKYTCRAGRKNPDKEIEDLKKAAFYLAWEIEVLTAYKENRAPCKPNQMDKPKPSSENDCQPNNAPCAGGSDGMHFLKIITGEPGDRPYFVCIHCKNWRSPR